LPTIAPSSATASSRGIGSNGRPRVTLESGCRFKGAIDMDRSERAARTPGKEPVTTPKLEKKEEAASPLKPAAGLSS